LKKYRIYRPTLHYDWVDVLAESKEDAWERDSKGEQFDSGNDWSGDCIDPKYDDADIGHIEEYVIEWEMQ